MEAAATKHDIILHLEKSKWSKLSPALWGAIAPIMLVTWICWTDKSVKWEHLWVYFSVFDVAFIIFMIVGDYDIFTTITLYRSSIEINRLFRKPLRLPLSDIQVFRSWNIWGKNLRPSIKFFFSNASKKPTTVVHHFYRKQLMPLYQYLTDQGIEVYTHDPIS